MFYNSFATLNNSMFLEYPNNNASLSWDDKVELELSALKDTTNIWNNSSMVQPSEVKEMTKNHTKAQIKQNLWKAHREYKQRKADLISVNGNEEQETIDQVIHYASAPTPEPANEGMNINIEETQIQTAAEPPDEKNNQVTEGPNPDTNSPEMEMINPSENSSTTPVASKTGVRHPKVNTMAQQEALGILFIPAYMSIRGMN
ncbi:18587_t:CDS:2 [Gigaspora rosea]|nr:18587_t:CDS:2 [Gigaspora rosea]